MTNYLDDNEIPDWHVWGQRAVNANHGGLWPRELVNARAGVDRFTLYNDVEGAADWLVG